MKLSERDEELQLLNQLYGGCVRGKGSVVLTNGPVGCGKTALLQTFAEHVEERGGRFLSVTASATEKLHLFGLIDQLGNAMRTGGTTADLFAAEDGVTVSADAESQGAPQVPLGLLQRISRAVADSAEDRPLVLGIDDVHFADEPSLQCLRYLIRRIDSSAVMIVMNESSCHERELATLHAETLHLPYCHRIRIAPLTVAACHRPTRRPPRRRSRARGRRGVGGRQRRQPLAAARPRGRPPPGGRRGANGGAGGGRTRSRTGAVRARKVRTGGVQVCAVRA